MDLENKILKLVEKEVEDAGISIKSIEYVNEDNINYLRITIDKMPYVTSEDCVMVTKIINPILDSNDLIEESYILDVCSLERGE